MKPDLVPGHTPISRQFERIKERLKTKIGNTREHLVEAWGSFHCNENAEIIDAYVQRVGQMTAMFNYGEPQIWKCLKTPYPHN